MTSIVDNDPFFDSDGDQEKEEPFTLKGEYHRGVTPPSQLTKSPQDDKPSPGNSKAGQHNSLYSQSSTSGNFSAESDSMSHKRDSSGSYYGRSRSRSRSPAYSRSRSRSPSHSRSKSRTPTYSDSFDSEDSLQDSRRASPVKNRKSTRRSPATTSRYSSGGSKDSRSTYRTYGVSSSGYGAKSTKPNFKKGAQKKKGVGRSQSVNTLQQSPRSNEVARRMLSAKGHTINKLRSDFDDLRRKYDDVIRENKLMKQLQRRQEAALAKFEDKDEELPQLLRSHAAEVDNLRERLRRTQDREKDKDRRIKDKNEELNKLNDELKKLRHLADNKRLLERDKLQRKVDRLQDDFDEKERRVNELEKHIENVKKNTRHDTEQWKQREREYRARVAHLEEENQTMKYQLKEKEKELEIRNIYSNRVMKPPGKLDHTPRPLAQTRATSNDDIKSTKPPPPAVKRSSSAEEKRKIDRTPREPKEEPKPVEKKETPRKEEKKKEVKKEVKKELSEHDKILMDLDAGFKPSPPPSKVDNDILRDLDNDIKKRERLDEEKARAEERRKREKEEEERKQKAGEEERRRLQKEEEERKRKEEERKDQLGFFSGPKNPYQSSRTKAKTSAYEPYFPVNSKSSANTSKAPATKSSQETDSYKPSFGNVPKASDSSYKRSSWNAKNNSSEPSRAENLDSYKPSFLPSTTTGTSSKRGEEGFGVGGVGRVGRREEKKPFWLRDDGKEDGSQQGSSNVSSERERKKKEEEESSFSAPKTPVFNDASSEDEDNIPFFGSKPTNAPPSKPKAAPPPSNSSSSVAAVNSVRDLHKYSSNARQSSGSSKPDSRESGGSNDRRKEEEDLAAQRKKQKEESERLAEERKKKDLLLAKMREIDSKPESRGSKKEYKFTEPIQNLHNGKPSHPDLLGSPKSSPKKKPAADSDATFGGYAPSFGRRAGGDKPPIKKGGLFDDDDDSDDFFSTKPKPAEKSNPFADSSKSSTPNKGRNSFEGSIFSTSTKAKPVADSATLPWEKKTQPGSLFNQSNKPNGLTVNVPKTSFDDFDDDIEEVIL